MEDAVKLLVTRFIPLNSADMEAWMADPEEWLNAEESEEDHWEYELRVRYRLICIILRLSLIVPIAMCRACAHGSS